MVTEKVDYNIFKRLNHFIGTLSDIFLQHLDHGSKLIAAEKMKVLHSMSGRELIIQPPQGKRF